LQELQEQELHSPEQQLQVQGDMLMVLVGRETGERWLVDWLVG
jgi:hypothetical protein